MTLHSEQDAIKQAVQEGRYLCNPGNAAPSTVAFKNDGRTVTVSYSFKDGSPTGTKQDFPIAWILQDPAFWQALGKARGWEGKCQDCVSGEPSKYCKSDWHDQETIRTLWKHYALRYFETRLSNGDMKAYWESLP